MLKKSLLHHLEAALCHIANKPVEIINCRQVFGGDINSTYVLNCGEDQYFVKLNTAALADMLLKEMDGLQLLRTANTSLAIPEPFLHGTFEQQSYLLMEYLEKNADSKPLWQQLANGLAQLHRNTQNSFGLHYNNYIASIPQHNTTAATWSHFYARQRILPLIQQAYDEHKCTLADVQLAEQFCRQLPDLMPEEPPALLHGDLWSGNRMMTAKGAAIYDPAVYFGHREMDLAMTLLFGGFDALFYTTYNEVFPLQEGWRNRVDTCQLYPLLVHLILFGDQYYNSVKRILKKYA